MSETMDRVKTHLRKNKRVYIAAATGIVIGGAAVTAALLASGQIVIVDSFKLQWKTTTNNNVIATLVRRGHPGNLIRCNETGEVFASQNRAADLMKLSPSNLSQHLNGKYKHVNGYTFENLGEAV